MQLTKHHLFFLLITSMLLITQFSTATEPPIKIGVISSLDAVGATWSESAILGMELAVRQINKEGGIGGRSIKLIHEDDQFDKKRTLSAYRKLTEIEKVDVLIGPQFGETLSAVAPIARREGRIIVTTVTTTPMNTTKHDVIIHSSPPDKFGGACLAHTMISDGRHKVVFLVPQESYSETFAGYVRDNLQGIDVQSIEYPADTTDFSLLLLKAKSLAPDSLVLFFTSPEAAGMAYRKMDELKFRVPVYSNEVLHNSDSFIKSSGEIAEGTTYCIVPFNSAAPKVAAILNSLKKKPSLPLYSVMAYDTIYWLSVALKKAGTDQKKLLDEIYSMKFPGSFAEYSFDEYGDLNFTSWAPWQVTATGYSPKSSY